MARPQINVRVTEEKKSKWKKAAESPEYDSLTHLIQLSVGKEIADQTPTDREATQAGLDDESSDLLREIAGSTERVEDGLTDVKARLRQLEERVGESGPEFSLQAAVRETLPERPELDPGTPDNPHEYGLTAKQIAARLNANQSDVRDALDTLTAESSEVEGRLGGPDSETYYFHTGGV
jgi:hypothetical protein